MPGARWIGIVAFATFALVTSALATEANAHLRRPGESLVGLLAASDAVVLAEATAATRDERDASGRLLRAETTFRVRRTIAGRAPEADTFQLFARPPPLRYARGQVAIVLIARDDSDGERAWRSAQGTGAGLVLRNADLPPDVERSLAELWRAARKGVDTEVAASALERLLDAQPQKLALMAALDLADLAHAGRLPAEVARALRARLADPELASELRAALEHALARRRSAGPCRTAGSVDERFGTPVHPPVGAEATRWPAN